MTVPAHVGERIARTLRRGGMRTLVVVSVCRTERGARRVAKRYTYAEVHPGEDGTWTVRAVRDDR